MARATRRRSRANFRPSTRLTRKLRLAFTALLLITLALSWYFYDSVTWYEYDLKRMALANEALHGYQSVANFTQQMIGDPGERRITAEPEHGDSFQAEISALRQAIDSLRQALTAEVALARSAEHGEKLVRLAELERVLGSIISTQEDIHQALQDGRTRDAAIARERFQSSGVDALFTQMIEAELEDQRRRVSETHQEAVDLAVYITGALPIFVTLLTLLTFVVIWFFSRSLMRSIDALRAGAIAFRSGNLQYRIPELREEEFRRLGEAFNSMAKELSDHRTQQHDANIKLEAIVDERTRALKSSNERLAAIDDNRRKLLADISHEFRTPLTVIQGEAEIALRGGRKSPADYRDSLSRIRDQARQTTRLVDDLLFIARAEVGEPRLLMEPTPLVGTLEGVCADFAASAQKKHIRLSLSRPDDDWVLRADTGRLRQVFAVLLDNALRYSNEGDTVEVGINRSGGEVDITFSDHGIGLSEDEAQQVFERFYRGNRAAGCEQGSGLGLPVARAIVEAHEGRIVLEPREGGGTVARVTLPVGPMTPDMT